MDSLNSMATVVHIGFHKTGTTTLQQRVFPELEGCAVLRGGRSGEPMRFRDLIRELAASGDPDYRGDELRSLIEASRGDADVLIVTHEDISASPDAGRTADRLLDLVPDARILVCVREQRSAARRRVTAST